ncbi:MAG: hypothetical protein Q9225_003251 [Loekoesia sp. 1 TL-2023]
MLWTSNSLLIFGPVHSNGLWQRVTILRLDDSALLSIKIMSGAELYLGVLGAVIPALQAANTAKGRSAKLAQSRLRAKDIAELHNAAGQGLFPAIYTNLNLYQEVVEPNDDGKDQEFASNLQSIYRTLKESQETAQELYNASKGMRSNPEDLKAMEDKLGVHALHLINSQLSLMFRFLLQQLQFQRLGRDGGVALVPTLTEQSESSASTPGLDIEPIKVSYDGDPQLDWPIGKGDAALLETLFDPQGNNTKPTSRPSLALLLACRERLPTVVKLCLDYSADPTVTGEDGLGAIHNAIGTADVLHEPPAVKEILNMLIDQGVDASAPDSTKEKLRPLHRAVMTKNVSATKFLLEKNPDMVNMVDAEGKTALYHACATPNQKMALIEELVDKHADFAGKPRPLMPDCDGQAITRYLDKKDFK